MAAFEKSGQVRDAEKVTATLLTETPQEESGFSFRTEPPAGLALAVEFLGRRGDHAGVLRLLEKDTRWRAADLAGILHAKGPLDATPMGFIAAQALLGSGRKDEGRAVLARLIREASPYDPAYELAFSVFAPEELGALLDRAAAADRFEERPLIWKAEWLRRAGRLDEALTVIKQAVAIDPSDGEIGKGRRMRAYVIWGRIAADQGDTKTATFMKGVEKTIRTAESADTLEDAGLSTRAITRYTESLKFFSDAYCIQSRLALRLSEEGRLQEAAAHYEKAFELMPDSFGRMESHCFGCEGAFRGQWLKPPRSGSSPACWPRIRKSPNCTTSWATCASKTGSPPWPSRITSRPWSWIRITSMPGKNSGPWRTTCASPWPSPTRRPRASSNSIRPHATCRPS